MENNQSNPGAVIVDGRGQADLGVVRALGERGVPVYLLTNDRRSPVASSRYVKQAFPYPSPDADDDDRVQALIAVGRQFRHKPVFFSTGDSSLMLFSRHREALTPYFRHHIGEPELIEALYDKVRFARLAVEKGLAVPFSAAPRSLAELERVLEQFTFPVIVKPAEKARWAQHPELFELTRGNLKGVRIEARQELLHFYRAAARCDDRMVIQDYIEGRDEEIWSLHAYIDRSGEPVGVFTGQKLRTYPIHRGTGCFQVSRYAPAVAEAGLAALTAVGYTGHAVVQVKRVPGTDQFKIFEINCRYSSWNYLHTYAGVNMPYAAYRDSLGEKQAPLPRQQEGMRWIDAANDLRALRDYRRLGEWSVSSWLRSYPGDNSYAVFAWNDPLPALMSTVNGLRNAAGYPFRVVRRHLSTVPASAVGGQDA